MKTLQDLFEHTLQDVHYAEHAILKALPKMTKKASSPELKSAFEAHIGETREQVDRLTEIFKLLGKKPKSEKCDAIEGLIKEAEGVMEDCDDPEVLDAAMIGCAQAVEHYEIARYGTLRAWAEELGMDKAADLLQQTLDQEHACNDLLTQIAEAKVNNAADVDSDDVDDDDSDEVDVEPATAATAMTGAKSRVAASAEQSAGQKKIERTAK